MKLHKEKVDRQKIENGLSMLGPTANPTQFAYLHLNLSNQNLNSVYGIEEFKHIIHLDVSHNQLTALKAVASLRHLNTLNASNNQIQHMFDFTPILNNLREVDYSNNKICEISDTTSSYIYLRKLILDHNHISHIKGIKDMPSLKILSLNFNEIDVLDSLEGAPNLEELFASQNDIQAVLLETLQRLKTIDLSKNAIESLRGLRNLKNLRFVNLAGNNIRKCKQLHYLQQLPLLSEIDLSFNPVQSQKLYRLHVLYIINQMRMLDGVKVSAEEKVKAQNLFGEDLQIRKEIYEQYLPNEKFVDLRIHTSDLLDHESDSDNEDIGFIDTYDQKGKKLNKTEAVQNNLIVNERTMGYTGIPNQTLSARISRNGTSQKGSGRLNLNERVQGPDVPIFPDQKQENMLRTASQRSGFSYGSQISPKSSQYMSSSQKMSTPHL